MLTLTPERQFSIKANFDAHVDKIYNLIRLDYTEFLNVIPDENPTVEQVKFVALEIFQEVASYFRVSKSKDEFADYLVSYAQLFVFTGLLDGERSGEFFSQVIEIVQSCFKSTKELMEAPPAHVSEPQAEQN